MIYILKHISNENAGMIAEVLQKSGAPFREIALYAGEALPSPETVTAAIIMGGPMNVYEEEKHPFLRAEDTFIKALLSRETPCLGICLGAQLIAKALGAKVYKAARPEVGWDDVQLSGEAQKDVLFSQINGKSLRVLQWHEDTFDLPKGAVLLASSAVVPNQAYRYKDNIYGFQFHIEVNKTMLADWFAQSSQKDMILKEYEIQKTELGRLTASMIMRWLRTVEKVV